MGQKRIDWQSLGKAVEELLREYTREARRATQLLNAGAPQVVMVCERGHATVLHREIPELGGFARAIRRHDVRKFVVLPDWAVNTLRAMARMLEETGSALSGVPELADVELEGVRLTPQLRRLLAAAALQRTELAKIVEDLDARRREHAAKLAEALAQSLRLPPCPHFDPATKQRCGAAARPAVLFNAHLELLGLQHVASAASAMARAEAIVRQTGFERLMRLQGAGPSALAFLFWAAAINRRPDRLSGLYSYIGIAPVFVCPECRAAYKGAVRVCPRCGQPAIPTLPTKAVAAALGAPLRQLLWAQSRAWVLGRALLMQALAGRAPAVMAAVAHLASLHHQRYLDCWHRAGGDAKRARELGCVSHKLYWQASREPERFREYAVYAAVSSAAIEVVKIYIAAAVNARSYIDGGRPVEPYGRHGRTFWPPILLWKANRTPPEDYVEWFGADPEEFETAREGLNRRGRRLAEVYARARKEAGREAWETWLEVFAAAQSATKWEQSLKA